MIAIRQYTESDKNNWDAYVMQHPESTVFHLTAWKEVIEQTFGHKSIYLLALNPSSNTTNSINTITPAKTAGWEAERLGSKKQLKAEDQTRIQQTTHSGEPGRYLAPLPYQKPTFRRLFNLLTLRRNWRNCCRL